MRITGQGNSGIFPAHAAKAYGAKPSSAPSQPAPVRAATTPGDSYKPSEAVQNLIAARVTQAVNFDAAGGSAAPVPARVLQMYTRAADRVEAAVGIKLGQSLDVRG